MKEEELQIQDYVARPRRYVNIDGSNELTWGAMLCGFSCLDWLHAIAPRDSLWGRPWAQAVCMLALVLLVFSAGKALKRFVTYPRTGFVAYPDTVKRRMMPVVAAAAAAATVFVIAAVLRGGHLRMVTILGAVNFVFYAVAAQPLRPWKYGFLLLIAAGTLWVADAYALLFFGLAFLASGVTTLTLYLRQTRATP
jgi:hypothetical protein